MQKRWRRWLPVVGLWAAFTVIFERRLDPDFGWHVMAGRYILAHGVPAHDVFSYTAVHFPWVDHEWFSDVLTAGVMWIGGFGLVAAVFAAVWTAALVVGARRVHWPVLAVGFAAVAADAVARPNAWSALGLALVMLGAERGWRWRMIGLFALWANLHGGFVVGLVALGFVAVRRREYWLVLAGSALATLVNPYGWNVYVEIWRTLADPQLHGRVGEWAPLHIGPLSGFYVILVLFAVISRGWRRWEHALPAAVFVGAMTSLRHFPIFVVSSLGLLTQGYERLVVLVRAQAGWRRYVLLVMATGLVLAPVVKIARDPGNDFPTAQVAALREQSCAGNVFNDFDFGGYMIWQLPGTRVYIDGRMPSWADSEGNYFVRWQRVLSDEAYARSEFERYDVTCALVYAKRTRLIGQLEADGWQVSSQDAKAVLLRAR
jgi:hypothetical protein